MMSTLAAVDRDASERPLHRGPTPANREQDNAELIATVVSVALYQGTSVSNVDALMLTIATLVSVALRRGSNLKAELWFVIDSDARERRPSSRLADGGPGQQHSADRDARSRRPSSRWAVHHVFDRQPGGRSRRS
jgi:hypothetical protein